MSNHDSILDELDPNHAWHVAYRYYMHHRFFGLGRLAFVFGALAVMAGLVVQVSHIGRSASAGSQWLPALALELLCYASACAMFFFWHSVAMGARKFACDVTNCPDCTMRDIELLYHAEHPNL